MANCEFRITREEALKEAKEIRRNAIPGKLVIAYFSEVPGFPYVCRIKLHNPGEFDGLVACHKPNAVSSACSTAQENLSTR